MEGCEMMGMFVNPGNEAFAVALNSEIYVDKTPQDIFYCIILP